MATASVRLLSTLVFCAVVVDRSEAEPPQEGAALAREPKQAVVAIPQYLIDRPRGLRARDGADAPAQDLAVARGYAAFPGKGKVHNGQRITIMTAKTTYKAGEVVRVIHVHEAPAPGHKIWGAGPKAIQDEFVDGRRAPPTGENVEYDGGVRSSPGVDFNYEVSTYTFKRPGIHTIQWKGGYPQAILGRESNVLKITVTGHNTEPAAAGNARQ